jgi:peptidoglycan/LPS O-acetylase OafA/YrhL
MSVCPIFIIFAIALLTAQLLSLFFQTRSKSGRFDSLDGLRGYLALGVVIHHAAIWYFFLRNGWKWQLEDSNIYNNLGHVSVALFFMITGFLFWLKLLKGRTENIDWLKLYVSRFLRLCPLYFLMLILLALTIGIVTQFQLKQPPYVLLKNSIKWLLFFVQPEPDLNGFQYIYATGGMVWTLTYEWLFYLALPAMALIVGAIPPRRLVFASILVVVLITHWMHPGLKFLLDFCGGILAACFVHHGLLPKLLNGFWGSVLAFGLLMAVLICPPTAHQYLSVALLTIAFTIIAAGNSVFGVLTWSVSRFLGEFTYSIYLLHGLVLFWIFYFVIGLKRGATLSLGTHWLVISLSIPALLFGCCLTYRLVELPAMESSSKITRQLYQYKSRYWDSSRPAHWFNLLKIKLS